MSKKSTAVNRIILCLTPLVPLFCFFIFMHFWAPALQDSDSASELILSKLLAENGGILSRDWYYSTELRILNTQLVFTPLFKLFTDWHTVRVIGSVILMFILGICSIIFSVGIGLRKQWIFLCCCMLMVPFSAEYLEFVIACSYYVPHLCISLSAIGILSMYLWGKQSENSRKGKIYVFILVMTAFLSGLGGKRQILILYIPLFLTFLLDAGRSKLKYGNCRAETKNGIKFAGILLLSSAAGTLINNLVLSRFYHYWTWDSVRFTGFSAERMINTLLGFLRAFGLNQSADLSMLTVLHNIFAVVVIALLIPALADAVRLNNSRKSYMRERILALFILSGTGILIVLFSCTDMLYNDRYNLPVMVLAVPQILLFLKRRVNNDNRVFGKCVAAVLCIYFVNSAVFLLESIPEQMPTELMRISDQITSKGYTYGYGTFWNSNILTELSDGMVEMHVLPTRLHDVSSPDETYHWLQVIRHDTEIPDGKVFCIFRADEWETPFVQRMTKGTVLYESNQYHVYGYESYEAMKTDSMN